MITADGLRNLLQKLIEKTASCAGIDSAVYWDDIPAEARRANDDCVSGRLHMQSAYEAAQMGLAVLDGGDVETAKWWYDTGKSLYIAALERQLRPSDLENLGRPAAARGRPRKSAPAAKAPAKKRGRPRKSEK
jgi:hypothetical protein